MNRRAEPRRDEIGPLPLSSFPDDGTEQKPGDLASPPPTNGHGTATAPRRQARKAPTAAKEPTPIEVMGPGMGPAVLDDRASEPSPLEVSQKSAFLKVKRVTAHGPASGHDDGDDYVGHMGRVPHREDFEERIIEKWGGGDYEVSGLVDGKVKTVAVEVGGPSKPRVPDPDDGYYDGPPLPPPTSYARTIGPAPLPHYQQQLGGAPLPPPAGGFNGGSWGWPGSWPQPPQFPTNPQALAYHNMGQRVGVPQDDELAELRKELDASKERERQLREDVKVSELKAELERKDAEHKADMDRLRAEVLGKSNGGSELKELLAQQQQQFQQRVEEDRIAREQKRTEEEDRRREERDREDRRLTEERERRERDDKERRDREDREETRRREEAARDREARAAEVARQERHSDRMLNMMTSNQTKPADLVTLLGGLKQIAGGNQNVSSQIKDMIGAVAELKDLASDDVGEDDPAEKAQKFVAGVTTAAQPLVSEVGKWFQGAPPPPQGPPQGYYPPQLPPGAVVDAQGRVWVPRQVPAQAPPQQIPQQQHAPPPVVQPPVAPQQQPQGPPSAQQASSQVEQEAGRSGITPQQWGKILEHTVDGLLSQVPADACAEQLLTVLKTIDARPALEQLASSRLSDLRTKVNLLLMSNRVKDATHIERMKKFVELSDPRQPAAKWFGEYLTNLKGYFEALKQHLLKQQQAAANPAPPPVVQPPVAAPQPEPADGGTVAAAVDGEAAAGEDDSEGGESF